jgi:predicted Co/Zn/Cd cation transporter (cation efflux family)
VAVTTSLGVGIALRIKAKQFANLMFAGFLAAVGLVWLLRRVPHPSREAVLAAAASQWFPAALIGTLTVVTVGAGWVAYHLARTGLERFRPERDKLT